MQRTTLAKHVFRFVARDMTMSKVGRWLIQGRGCIRCRAAAALPNGNRHPRAEKRLLFRLSFTNFICALDYFCFEGAIWALYESYNQ